MLFSKKALIDFYCGSLTLDEEMVGGTRPLIPKIQ